MMKKMSNLWPFRYYSVLKNIECDTRISFYYDIDKDEIYEKSELENMKNYEISDRYLISGSRKNINKLYYDINNGGITRQRSFKLNIVDIINKFNKYVKKKCEIPGEIWLIISCYLETDDMLNLCKTCNKLYIMLLNNKNNMILHQFTLRKNVLNLNFIHSLSYKIHNLNLNFNEYIGDEDFKNLKGIHTLDMSYCNHNQITDKAFENLKGIHTLYMSYCNQNTITDDILYLLYIQRLYLLSYCKKIY